MKCKEAYICLLASQTPDQPPVELRQHLLRCTKCRRRQQRLLCLEEEIRLLPRPGEPADAQRRILELLEPRTPITLPAEPPVPQLRTQWQRWAGAVLATAALVTFALGLGLGLSLSQRGEPDGSVVQPRLRTGEGVANGPREEVVGRILENDLRLAQTSASRDRVTLLADMAAQLRGETLRLSQEGPVEDVLLVSGLYERVVCQGLLGRARLWSAAEQAELAAALGQQLRQAADDSDRAVPAALPGAGEGLRNLAAAARAAGANLTAVKPSVLEVRAPSWQPARSGTLRDLLGTLVLHGLRLAEEDDPLRRADYCNDVAEHLVQGILLASSGGDTERAAKLGGYLGSMMEQGVAPNLERFEPQGPEDARLTEADRIGERSVKTVEDLEKKLEQAPAAAQPGLKKALEASGNPPHGPGHHGKGRKHRGPPHLNKDMDRGRPMPPGMKKGKDAPDPRPRDKDGKD